MDAAELEKIERVFKRLQENLAGKAGWAVLMVADGTLRDYADYYTGDRLEDAVAQTAIEEQAAEDFVRAGYPLTEAAAGAFGVTYSFGPKEEVIKFNGRDGFLFVRTFALFGDDPGRTFLQRVSVRGAVRETGDVEVRDIDGPTPFDMPGNHLVWTVSELDYIDNVGPSGEED